MTGNFPVHVEALVLCRGHGNDVGCHQGIPQRGLMAASHSRSYSVVPNASSHLCKVSQMADFSRSIAGALST